MWYAPLGSDAQGNVWCHNETGLWKYDGNSWSLVGSSLGSRVRGLTVDLKGRVWTTAYSGGAYCFDGSTWTNYNVQNSPLGYNYCITIFADRHGNIWIPSDNYQGGLTVYNEDGVNIGVVEPYQDMIVSNFRLFQNYPNPFNPITTISFELPVLSFVNLSIYNVVGQLVETLVNEYNNAGFHKIEWNASRVGSGVYFYRIEAGEYTETKKCLILK